MKMQEVAEFSTALPVSSSWKFESHGDIEWALSHLCQCVISPDRSVRAAAERVLLRLPAMALYVHLQRHLGMVLGASGQYLLLLLQELAEQPIDRSVLRLLKDELRAINKTTLESIGTWRMQEELPDYLEALQEPHAVTRRCAAFLLGCTQDFRAVAPLLQVLRRDRSRHVRFDALAALRRLGYVEATAPGLLEVLRTSKKHPMRPYIARLLAEWGVQEVFDLILAEIDADAGPVHAVYWEALGLLRNEELTARIAAHCKHQFAQDPDFCFGALSAAQGCEDISLQPMMLALSKNESFEARILALRWLGEFADAEALDCLCDGLRDPFHEVRIEAVEALTKQLRTKAKTESAEILEALQSTLPTEWEPKVAIRIIHTLCSCGESDGFDALQKMLRDGDWHQRREGLHILGECLLRGSLHKGSIDLETAHSFLLTGLTDAQPEVRQMAGRIMFQMHQLEQFQQDCENALFD